MIFIMEKNDFLLLNELIYQMHTSASLQQIKVLFLKRLKQIVPYSYASIMMVVGDADDMYLTDPVCNPKSFEKAELEYLKMENIDHTDWIIYSPETVLVRESDIVKEQNRLTSPIYERCYRNYDIFDTLQMSIVYDKKVLGVLTIYRTREDGAFTDEDMFYVRSLSKHLNYIFHTNTEKRLNNTVRSAAISEVSERYHLTRRESEIMDFILHGLNNTEILEKINITDHTLQKHIQNIYRKCNVSTRWDLLKFL